MSRGTRFVGCMCLAWSGMGLAVNPLTWFDLIHAANIVLWTILFCEKKP